MTSLLSTLQAGQLTLTLNCPERANAFNVGLIGELQKAFTKAERDSHVRVIVLTGSGKAFSAGQDISEMKGGSEISYREHLEKTYNPLILQIRRIEKPIIAGINGPCAGAALGVALACDLRFATDETKFVVGFGGIGLIPDFSRVIIIVRVDRSRTRRGILFQQRAHFGSTSVRMGIGDSHFPIHKLHARDLSICNAIGGWPGRYVWVGEAGFQSSRVAQPGRCAEHRS